MSRRCQALKRGGCAPYILEVICSVSDLSDDLMLEVAAVQDTAVFYSLSNHPIAQSCKTYGVTNFCLALTSKEVSAPGLGVEK